MKEFLKEATAGRADAFAAEADGLEALRALDNLAARLKAALADHAGGVLRALEIGRGLDKVLVLDDGDRYQVFQRPLLRDAARWAFEAHRDGTIVVADGGSARKKVTCRSRYGVTVIGDYVRFADPTGLDLARVSIPWICREDREELARRIGELIHVGFAIGARALRTRFVFPGAAVGISYERLFLDGEDLRSIKIGARVVFDLDL